MKIRKIKVKDVAPIKYFNADELSETVVIAGPNASGKTNLLKALITFFRDPPKVKNIQLIIEATCDEEKKYWKKNTLDTSNENDAQILSYLMRSRERKRSQWKSNIIYFESDRSIQKITKYNFQFEEKDPREEQIDRTSTYEGLKNRFQDTQHSILRIIQSNREKMGIYLEDLQERGEKPTDIKFPDSMKPFKDAFNALLSPKKFEKPNLKIQKLTYLLDGEKFLSETLSSGEQEIVRIVFDFILRNPSDCIILFDEPDLHLHPEMTLRLIQYLKSVGNNNQFIFCTHSSEIITASLDNSVIFISPPIEPNKNQAIQVKDDDESHQALKLLGQSIGIIALGKKIVLIEGENSSLDKKVYGSILKDRFSDLVLVPCGGKNVIRNFATVYDEVFARSLWGVDFFMLCDRDTVTRSNCSLEFERKYKGRLKILKRYHIENYFLDEEILAKIFQNMEQENSWLTLPNCILEELKKIAVSIVSYTAALNISAVIRDSFGKFDIKPKECHNKTADELKELFIERVNSEKNRFNSIVNPEKIKKMVQTEYNIIHDGLENGTEAWKILMPGKNIFNIFASKAKISAVRLKNLYINEAEKHKKNPFKEIIVIFEHFASFK